MATQNKTTSALTSKENLIFSVQSLSRSKISVSFYNNEGTLTTVNMLAGEKLAIVDTVQNHSILQPLINQNLIKITA